MDYDLVKKINLKQSFFSSTDNIKSIQASVKIPQFWPIQEHQQALEVEEKDCTI
jgi:hypothetical protein